MRGGRHHQSSCEHCSSDYFQQATTASLARAAVPRGVVGLDRGAGAAAPERRRAAMSAVSSLYCGTARSDAIAVRVSYALVGAMPRAGCPLPLLPTLQSLS